MKFSEIFKYKIMVENFNGMYCFVNEFFAIQNVLHINLIIKHMQSYLNILLPNFLQYHKRKMLIPNQQNIIAKNEIRIPC